MTQKAKEENSPVYEKGYPSYEAVNKKENKIIDIDAIRKSGY